MLFTTCTSIFPIYILFVPTYKRCVFLSVYVHPPPPRFFIKKHTTKRHDSHRWPVVHRWYRSVHATWRFRSRRGKLPTWRYSDLPGETRFREAQTLQHQPPTWSLNNKRYTVIISVMKVTFFVLLRWTMVIQKPWLLWWSKIFIVFFWFILNFISSIQIISTKDHLAKGFSFSLVPFYGPKLSNILYHKQASK